MPGGSLPLSGTHDVSRVEAPVTVRAYLIVAFAAFGGIFFGYDTGWMGGVLNMDYFIKQYTGAEYPDVVYPNLDATSQTIKDYRNSTFVVAPSQQSLVTSILSAGYVKSRQYCDESSLTGYSTFFGAIMAGDIADFIGRRITIIMGCGIFIVGGILETASTGLGVMVAGRLIAGFGVGFISSIVILYMSEIAPKKVRGAVVAGEYYPLDKYAIHSNLDRVSILHYHRYLTRQLCGLCHSEQTRHRLVSNSDCRPVSVGYHSRHRSRSTPRVPSLLGQEGQARQGSLLPRPCSWSTS
jgi:hypothetical protein